MARERALAAAGTAGETWRCGGMSCGHTEIWVERVAAWRASGERAEASESQGIHGDLDSIITRAKGSDADALAARGELRAAERASARGHKVEMLAPPTGKEAQGVKSPEARLTRGGEELRMEAKTATSPPDSKSWNAHATKANTQIKQGGTPGEISFDWTAVDVKAAGSDFHDQASIERWLNGKMTKDRMREVRYFEIVWRDVDGRIVVTSRTRAADGTLAPVTSVKQ